MIVDLFIDPVLLGNVQGIAVTNEKVCRNGNLSTILPEGQI